MKDIINAQSNARLVGRKLAFSMYGRSHSTLTDKYSTCFKEQMLAYHRCLSQERCSPHPCFHTPSLHHNGRHQIDRGGCLEAAVRAELAYGTIGVLPSHPTFSLRRQSRSDDKVWAYELVEYTANDGLNSSPMHLVQTNASS